MPQCDDLKGIVDLNQFKTIIDRSASKYGTLDGLGISVDDFKADANNVVVTHVNNICADHLNTSQDTSAD